MSKKRFSRRLLLLQLALSAVVSLTIANGIELGHQAFGAGPASTVAIVGSVAGLIACAISARFGLRAMLGRSAVC